MKEMHILELSKLPPEEKNDKPVAVDALSWRKNQKGF